MIVLIDVSLSHLFVFLLHLSSFSPFRCLLSCSRSSIAWVTKCRKGVDQFDLYLASGLGTSLDKNPKETKCETLVYSCSQQPVFSLFPSPLLAREHHLETFESRTARALAPFVACVNANIDSCLLRLELNCMLWLLYLTVLIWLCGMSPQKLCLLSFTYSRTSRN